VSIHPDVLDTLDVEEGFTRKEKMSFHGFYHLMLLNYRWAKRLFIDLVTRELLDDPAMTQDE
jgi:hypothetical protein